LAEQGAYKDYKNNISKDIHGECGSFEYWSLSKNKNLDFGRVSLATRDSVSEKTEPTYVVTADFIDHCYESAADAIDKYILGNTAFEAQLKPEYAKFNDYEHLSRLMEWYGRQAGRSNDHHENGEGE